MENPGEQQKLRGRKKAKSGWKGGGSKTRSEMK